MASHDAFSVHYKVHAKDQMDQRGLLIGDVLHVLKHGFVYGAPVPATRKGLYKYAIECTTPNSAFRSVRVIVIPHYSNCEAKIVTVMWADEPMVGV